MNHHSAPPELMRLRESVRRNPQDFLAWVMLSEAELDHNDPGAGLQAAERALMLHPGHPEALARQGRAYWMQGRHPQAAEALRHASTQAPQHPGIALWLGHALEDVPDMEAASQAYERAFQLMPAHPIFAAHLLNVRRRLCDWRDLDRLSGQIRRAIGEGHGFVEPFAFLSEDAAPAEQLACARLRAAGVAQQVRPLPPAPARERTGPLRLGFLSNGFGSHPTGLLTVALFEALRSQGDVEAHLFALNRNDHSPIRQRLDASTRMHEVAGLTHAQVAHLIRGHGIDILFDLRGWGGGGAPEVLAMRPAPVQVNWLAYPGTSGAPWIDYVLADRFVLPDALAPHFSEAVVRLPGCFQPSDIHRPVSPSPSRAECGLPGDAVVFACFNNSYKLNPASFARMAAVLREVPDGILWLLSGPGRADDRLREAARNAGVDPARLHFMRKLPHADYMARYRHADLFLDTGPYNAHTTASDALWAGCPVLTRPGETFASRVAGSLNHHLGLGEMNVDSDEAFIARAVRLGNDAGLGSGLRERLARARQDAGLFDMVRFAKDFADACQQMAGRHRQGLPPAPFG